MDSIVSGQNKKIRILILISVLGYGGTETQTLHLVKALRQAEYEVEVVCLYEYYDDVVSEFKDSGAVVTLLKFQDRKRIFKIFRSLYYYYLARRPDVIHVQYIEQGFIAVLAAWLAKIPIRFATVHQLGTPYRVYNRLLLRTASRMTTMFLSVSEAVERSWFNDSRPWILENHKIRKHNTIHNCVDIKKIKKLVSDCDKDNLRKRYRLKKDIVIGIVGRTNYNKGQLILIDAISRVVKIFPDIQVLIVGQAHQRDEIIARASSYGLKNKVFLTGKLSPREVCQLYSIMDILIVPSTYEGFGLTAVEAMAAGLPVIASRVGGLTEIVKDHITGILVEPQNTNQLANAIVRILENPEYAAKLGEAGRQRAEEIFSFDVYARDITTLYQWAIDKYDPHKRWRKSDDT
jgi:glycosyltransferase involved in cell wall biosynthesis